jgi:carbamoyltransferase
MHILGVSCYFHDAAAVLLRDGLVVAAAEEERFSRVKHDYSFPTRAIRFCLERGGIEGRELDYVAFFEKPFVKFERILQTAVATAPRSAAVFREAMAAWLLDKLWVKSALQSTLGVPPERILFCEHHESHAASAFLCSPFEEAAILTVDGVGEWTTTAIGAGRGGTVRLTNEVRFPHSLGLLYSAFTAFLGFEVNEGEYKVMGMAPYGVPRFVDEVWRLVRVEPDGSFELDLDYFSFNYSPTRTFTARFEALFGAPRKPGLPFFTEHTEFPAYYGEPPANFAELARENQRYADLAASIQAVTEEILLRMARHAMERAGSTRLCMAGGVALNSVANGRILRETPVTDLYIQPAAGDSGAALGAALYVWNAVLGNPRGFVLDHAFWGEDLPAREVTTLASGSGLPCERYDRDEELIDRTVGLLAGGAVVGWAQGRFEWGPRALGHRSILADPRSADAKNVVNVKIKFREPYRPFAPAVPVEHAARFFDLLEPRRQLAARFMLLVVPVRPEARGIIPAVTHVDGTARLQTVAGEGVNDRYYRLISRFGEATGVPVLLNTSFNLRGEPIVNTPQEAFSTFMRSGMDALVLDRTILLKDRS